jgi:hypothetical protein
MAFSWAVFWGSLITGLISVAASVTATITYNRWAEVRRLQVDCFRQFCRYSPSDDEYFRAFNEAPALFYKKPKILAAHKLVLDSGNLVGDEMADFFFAVADEIGMNSGDRRQMLRRLSITK